MPPKPRICRLRQRVLRMRRQPGIVDVPHLRMRGEELAPAPGRWRCAAAMRSGSVLVPRRTSHESNGLRIAPAAFCTNLSHSMSSSRDGDDDAADAVAVAVQVFGRAVHDQVGAELDRPLHDGAGEGVVDDQPDVVARARGRRPRARSVSRITGLVGVSTNSIRVAGVNARSTASRSRRVDVAERQLVARQHLVEQPERAAVDVVGHDDVVAGLRAACAIAPIAAMPDANANAALPPSIAARLPSSAARVGFWVRAYSKPLCLPSSSCT